MDKEVTQEQVAAGIAQMCEPDDAVKRSDLEAFLRAGGSVMGRITERGVRSKALLQHKLEHEDCGESCEEMLKLQSERDKFTGPEMEYRRTTAEEQKAAAEAEAARKERLRLTVMWVAAALVRLRDQGFISTNFPIQSVTETGLNGLGSFEPTKEEAKDVMQALLGKVDEKTLDDIVVLAFGRET